MSEVNVPLLRKAVEWAEAEAAKPIEMCEWEQGEYVATPRTQKYWRDAYAADGDRPDLGSWHGRLAIKSTECGTCYCIGGYVDSLIETDSSPFVGDRAAALLGLDEQGAKRLFAEGNTIEDVRRIAEEIAGESL